MELWNMGPGGTCGITGIVFSLCSFPVTAPLCFLYSRSDLEVALELVLEAVANEGRGAGAECVSMGGHLEEGQHALLSEGDENEMHVCLGTTSMQCLQKPEDVRSTGLPVIDACELPCGNWESNLDPLQE
ncbi:hypothetical protein STEG23_011864 [Scotinomys teguina]